MPLLMLEPAADGHVELGTVLGNRARFQCWLMSAFVLIAAGVALMWVMQFLSYDLRLAVINDIGYCWRTLTHPYATAVRGAATGLMVATGGFVWHRGPSKAATFLAAWKAGQQW